VPCFSGIGGTIAKPSARDFEINQTINFDEEAAEIRDRAGLDAALVKVGGALQSFGAT
jgi:hypothetical protein